MEREALLVTLALPGAAMCRRVSRWGRLAAIAHAVSLPAAAVAQQSLSLSDAQAEARAHAPEAAELEARLQGASAIAQDAHRTLRTDPTISGHLGNSLPGGPAERSWGVGLDWTIDVSGSWASRGASADADRQQVAHQREDGLRALDEAVAITVADLAFAQRQVGRAERIAALQDVVAAATQRLLEAGQGNQLDVDAAALDLAAAQTSLAQARGERERAQARLARLLGREMHAGLAVQDPPEAADAPSEGMTSALVEQDPRVRAASAALEAARLDLATNERLLWPMPTFGVGLEHFARDIPATAFAGGPAGLEARWTDWELVGKLTLPLPLFDRRTEARVRSQARLWPAESHLATVRADVRAELAQALAECRSAAVAYRAIAPASVVIERDYDLLDKALRAGSIDAVARTQAMQRLAAAGARLDVTIRGLRVARAHWIRRRAN